MVSFTSVALLATAAVAVPLSQRQVDIPAGWTWTVEGSEFGCGRQSCSYNFNVTIPTVTGLAGGVKAYCSGSDSQADFKSCEILEGVNNGVMAKFVPSNSTSQSPQQFAVQFERAAYEPTESLAYFFTAFHDTIYNAGVAEPQTYTMEPTQVYAVA